MIRVVWVAGWLMGGMGGIARAETPVPLTVTTTEDNFTVDGKCSLREAIQAANTNQAVDSCPAGSGADTILLPAGVFTLAIPGMLENENQTGDLDILSDLTIQGAGMDQTIIDGGALDRVIDGPDVEADIVINDLTIRNGLLRDAFPDPQPWATDPPGHGAGIRGPGLYGSLTITRVRITQNMVDQGFSGSGAALYTNGPTEVHSSEIVNNEAADAGGGIVSTRQLLVEDTLFQNNYGYGAAALWLTGTAAIRNSRFTGNHCGPMGEMISITTPTVDWLTVEFSGDTFTSNQCEGATISQASGNVTIAHSLFRGNSHWSNTLRQDGGKLTLVDTAFDQELANVTLTITGGAAQIERTSITRGVNGNGLHITGGVVQATNVTISDAQGGEFGDGITVEDGSLLMESVTLANLQSDFPALHVTGGQVIVHNSLVANNRLNTGERADCGLALGSTVSEGFNLISNGDGCGWRAVSGDQVGTLEQVLDPRLGPLTLDANQTYTRPLLSGSPALNQADPTLCPAVDQRGVARPQAGRCDIGAYEAMTSAPTATPTATLTPTATPTRTPTKTAEPIVTGYSVFMPLIRP